MEAGSYDAESRSDSLHFEINRGWKVRHRIIFVILHLVFVRTFMYLIFLKINYSSRTRMQYEIEKL